MDRYQPVVSPSAFILLISRYVIRVGIGGMHILITTSVSKPGILLCAKFLDFNVQKRIYTLLIRFWVVTAHTCMLKAILKLSNSNFLHNSLKNRVVIEFLMGFWWASKCEAGVVNVRITPHLTNRIGLSLSMTTGMLLRRSSACLLMQMVWSWVFNIAKRWPGEGMGPAIVSLCT